MVRLTSFVTFAAIVASIAAAPTSIETNTTATSTTSTPTTTTILDIPTALPKDIIEGIEDDSEIGIASKDPFSTSVTHRGKATWFTHHYGACNYYWNGYKEPVVALSARMMGPESWGNPFCGRRVRVVNRNHPGRVVIGRIVDKCPGDECAFGSLDLSPAAFRQLGHLDTGVLNITWNFV
ncbi:hypothetical protein BGZ81_007270 [Podila clonocystis]|nr:hypothetical protein BGZ81_007270 [Podila clonocystis]